MIPRPWPALLLASSLLTACAGDRGQVQAPPLPKLGDGAAADVRERARMPTAERAPSSPLAVMREERTSVVLPPPVVAGGRSQVLVRMDGRDVTTADLGDFVLRYFPARAADALTQLVDEELVRAEARREGVSVPDEWVESRTEAYLDERRREAKIQYGRDADLADLVKREYGRDLAAYREDARRLARTSLLLDRLVRLHQLREDRVEVRVLVVPTELLATRAAERLTGGADMLLLAEQAGMARPQSPPPLSRTDVSDEELRTRLFAASNGDVLPPSAFLRVPRGGGEPRTWWQVVKVLDRWSASDASWEDLSGRVEGIISRAGPAGPREYVEWKRRAVARHRVQVRNPADGFVPWPGPPDNETGAGSTGGKP